MYNWSVNTNELKKNRVKYAVWKLEQLINYGLNGEKISMKELKKYFNKLDIDPIKKKYLKFLIRNGK